MTQSFETKLALLSQSGAFDPKWYAARYPDVAQSGLHPAQHYLKYGRLLRRNPTAEFDMDFYLQTYPDVRKEGVDPFLHYATQGKAEGRACNQEEMAWKEGMHQIRLLRENLLSCGLTKAPLGRLNDLAQTAESPRVKSLASLELAVWFLHTGQPDAALNHLASVQPDLSDQATQCRAHCLKIVALAQLGRSDAAWTAHCHARLTGRASPDADLALTSLETSPEARLHLVNLALTAFGIPALALGPHDLGETPYDRLTSAQSIPFRSLDAGPRVSVLVAAHNAAATLPTTLRALREQSWTNLEILVIDDASQDETAKIAHQAAAQDGRVSVLRLAQNAGAYVARNHGLAQATGEYVTLLDADDWVHPLRIETQLSYLESHPEVMGCTSRQVRVQSDLIARRWTGQGDLIQPNVASLMFRRRPIREKLGFWDTVRVSADSELIRRMRHCFGADAVQTLPTGPLTLQRDTEGSAIRSGPLGMPGFLYGARREYRDAQLYHHRTSPDLRYADPQERPHFAVPRLMRGLVGPQHVHRVVAGDFRRPGPALQRALEECARAQDAGYDIGIVEIFLFDPEIGAAPMQPELRQHIDGSRVRVLVHGEDVTCTMLLVLAPAAALQAQRYLPQIVAETICASDTDQDASMPN